MLTYWVKAAPEAGLQAVESEVASLKKSVSDGKTLVAGAITDKGITTATDAAFATMADNINQISTLAADTADATATAAQILAGAKAYVKGSPVVGTMPNNGGPSTAIAAGKLKAGYTSGGAITNLTAENIKSDVNIGGVVGQYLGDLSKDVLYQREFNISEGDIITFDDVAIKVKRKPIALIETSGTYNSSPSSLSVDREYSGFLVLLGIGLAVNKGPYFYFKANDDARFYIVTDDDHYLTYYNYSFDQATMRLKLTFSNNNPYGGRTIKATTSKKSKLIIY